MPPWHPLAFLADMQTETWRKLPAVVHYLSERGPGVIIGTIVLGIARLSLIAILAISQFWRRSRQRDRSEPYRGSVDVLVPAYNEEKVVCKTVESILSSNTVGELKVIVIDDGSTDKTSQVLKEQFPDEHRLILLRKENGGKATALNCGLSRSSADVVVAIDGDTILLPDAIARLTAHFSDRRLGAVAGNVVVGNAINLMTRFQALEYVTSQNLDRRAFELLNAIGVVPGAIGAWRRGAILQAGGYARDTMAEDADLTFCLQLQGWRVLSEPSAVALTEAPETLRAFMKQRYRWMFGTLQVACKHIRASVRRPTGISLVTTPNIFVFQMGFTLLAPIMDAVFLWTIVGGFYFGLSQQAETVSIIAKYWVLFQTVDGLAAAIGISLDRERRYWRLLPLLLLQRFTYRQLLYVTAIRSLLTASRGTLVGWNKLVRTGKVFGGGRTPAST